VVIGDFGEGTGRSLFVQAKMLFSLLPSRRDLPRIVLVAIIESPKNIKDSNICFFG